MDLYRVRIHLDDSPSRLGQAAAALGELDVNILDVDVQTLDGQLRADDLLIDLTVPTDLRAIEVALNGAGCKVFDLRPADPHELTDSGTRCLEVAHVLMASDGHISADRLAESARRLVRADLAWVASADESHTDSTVARAFSASAPVLGLEQVQGLPRESALPWNLAIPFGIAGETKVLALVRRSPRFTFSETARVQAMLRLVAIAATECETFVGLDDGGEVTFRRLRADDAPALSRMHARCSGTSLEMRYSTPAPSDHALEELVEVDDDRRIGLVATLGSEIVGVAHAVRGSEADTPEIAFLVEDGHQKRGIGSALLNRLTDRLLASGVDQLVVRSTPENLALPRLMRRPGWTMKWTLIDDLMCLEVTPPADRVAA